MTFLSEKPALEFASIMYMKRQHPDWNMTADFIGLVYGVKVFSHSDNETAKDVVVELLTISYTFAMFLAKEYGLLQDD